MIMITSSFSKFIIFYDYKYYYLDYSEDTKKLISRGFQDIEPLIRFIYFRRLNVKGQILVYPNIKSIFYYFITRKIWHH